MGCQPRVGPKRQAREQLGERDLQYSLEDEGKSKGRAPRFEDRLSPDDRALAPARMPRGTRI